MVDEKDRYEAYKEYLQDPDILKAIIKRMFGTGTKTLKRTGTIFVPKEYEAEIDRYYYATKKGSYIYSLPSDERNRLLLKSGWESLSVYSVFNMENVTPFSGIHKIIEISTPMEEWPFVYQNKVTGEKIYTLPVFYGGEAIMMPINEAISYIYQKDINRMQLPWMIPNEVVMNNEEVAWSRQIASAYLGINIDSIFQYDPLLYLEIKTAWWRQAYFDNSIWEGSDLHSCSSLMSPSKTVAETGVNLYLHRGDYFDRLRSSDILSVEDTYVPLPNRAHYSLLEIDLERGKKMADKERDILRTHNPPNVGSYRKNVEYYVGFDLLDKEEKELKPIIEKRMKQKQKIPQDNVVSDNDLPFFSASLEYNPSVYTKEMKERIDSYEARWKAAQALGNLGNANDIDLFIASLHDEYKRADDEQNFFWNAKTRSMLLRGIFLIGRDATADENRMYQQLGGPRFIQSEDEVGESERRPLKQRFFNDRRENMKWEDTLGKEYLKNHPNETKHDVVIKAIDAFAEALDIEKNSEIRETIVAGLTAFAVVEPEKVCKIFRGRIKEKAFGTKVEKGTEVFVDGLAVSMQFLDPNSNDFTESVSLLNSILYKASVDNSKMKAAIIPSYLQFPEPLPAEWLSEEITMDTWIDQKIKDGELSVEEFNYDLGLEPLVNSILESYKLLIKNDNLPQNIADDMCKSVLTLANGQNAHFAEKAKSNYLYSFYGHVSHNLEIMIMDVALKDIKQSNEVIVDIMPFITNHYDNYIEKRIIDAAFDRISVLTPEQQNGFILGLRVVIDKGIPEPIEVYIRQKVSTMFPQKVKILNGPVESLGIGDLGGVEKKEDEERYSILKSVPTKIERVSDAIKNKKKVKTYG